MWMRRVDMRLPTNGQCAAISALLPTGSRCCWMDPEVADGTRLATGTTGLEYPMGSEARDAAPVTLFRSVEMRVAKPTTAPGLAPAEDEHAGKWTVLGIVALGVFMATLDSSVVNISLPSIARHFGRPLDTAVMWVVIAYLV